MKCKSLLTALAFAGIATMAQATAVTDYTEGFDNAGFRPKGWTNIGNTASYSKATFTVHTDGGHTGGYITVDQYSAYFSSYYQNYSYFDLLATPTVSGTVTLWVKANGTNPQLTFYRLADQATAPASSGGFTAVAETGSNIVADMDLTDWTAVTVTVDQPTVIGIRAHNLAIDDFSASNADVTYRASLLANVEKIGGTTLNADENGKVTIPFKVSLENNGDVDFPASDEGFTISLINAAVDNTTFGTGNITRAINWGETAEKEFSFTNTPLYKDGVTSYNYKVKISHPLTGDLETSLAYYTIIPYRPNPKFMLAEGNSANQSSYNDVNINEPVTIGMGAGSVSRTLWMWNSGTAAMNVTSTTLTGGFSADCDAFTLAPDEKKAITVTLAGDNGFHAGAITFAEAQIGNLVYNLNGYIAPQGCYVEDFEGANDPAGWVLGTSWTHVDTPAALKTLGDDKCIFASSTYSVGKCYTPLLHFEEGDQLCWMATKSDNTSAVLKVYTSVDRVNWTLLGTIDTKSDTDEAFRFSSLKPTGTGYGTYEYKTFALPMAAGDCYVAFEAGGARVDNVMGGTLADVSHDLYVTKTATPATASVNTRFLCSVNLRNLLPVTESDYTVALTIDGKDVAFSDNTADLEPNAEQIYTILYTPHFPGEYTGTFTFISGDDRVELSSFTFTVAPEKAIDEYQTGDIKITTSDPLQVFYEGAQAQIIYRASQLTISDGAKISGLRFIGYCDETDIRKHIKVWIGNTTVDKFEEPIDPVDRSELTLVADYDYTFPKGGNKSANEYITVFNADFDAPFTYTGGNLLVMIQQVSQAGYDEQKHVFFCVDNSVYDFWNDIYDDRVIENKQEFAEDLDDEPNWIRYKAGFPVTFFSVTKDVLSVNGNVTEDFDAAVADAVINFASDDILYTATTDEDGAYTVKIFNPALTFDVEVLHDDFDDHAQSGVSFADAQGTTATHNIRLAWTDRSATLSGKVLNSNDNAASLAGLTVTLGNSQCITDAEGNYSLSVDTFDGQHTLTVHNGDDRLLDDIHIFTSKADTRDLLVGLTSLDNVALGADTRVSANGLRVSIDAPAGTTVVIVNAAGQTLLTAASTGRTLTFTAPTPGLYIVAGHKLHLR